MILTTLDFPSRFSLVLSESVLCPISLAQPITGDAPYSRLPLTEQRVKSYNIHRCLTINYVTFQVTPTYYLYRFLLYIGVGLCVLYVVEYGDTSER